MKRKVYESVTANINPDGSPCIIAWRGKTFDSIPISDGKGGTIPKVSPVDPRHLAALVAAARAVASPGVQYGSPNHEARCRELAEALLKFPTA